MVYFNDLQEQLRSFFRNRALGWSMAVSIIGNAVLWGTLVARMGTWPSVIPLHYTIYFGIDLYGPWYKLFALPTLGLVVLVVNSLAAVRLFNRERIASYFLMISSALVQLILLTAASTIINLGSV